MFFNSLFDINQHIYLIYIECYMWHYTIITNDGS